MTEAENLIGKGLRAVTYTKGESKVKGTHTREEDTMKARRESEHQAILRPFKGQAGSLVCYLKRGEQSTHVSYHFFNHSNLIH